MAAAVTQEKRFWFGVAAVIFAATAAHGAEPAASPFELRAEGSFPVEYTEATRSGSQQHILSAAPYLGLTAKTQLQPDLSAALFVDGGHSRLGSFRDTDNTFASVGVNLVKQWTAALSTGVSIEHTDFFNGTFGPVSTIANDVNIFARYDWLPNPNLRIKSSVTATMRVDDALAVQRYTYGGRIDIEQRIVGAWWLVTGPRFRYYDYVGTDAGRRDTRAAIVAGVKYEFNDSVSAMMLTGYDTRQSNVAGKSVDRYFVGVSLDFNVNLTAPRWPAGI